MRRFELDPSQPFFLFRRKNSPRVCLCTGHVTRSRSLDELPIRTGAPGRETLDSVSLIPFSQARERGWPVHDANDEIVTLHIDHHEEYPLDEVLAALPRTPVALEGLAFDTSAAAYEETIRRILEDEIGSGQGANFVIARRCRATLAGFGVQSIPSIFRSLLVNEFGTYWTFAFSDGDTHVLGATPERHISLRDGDVMMNPISGTFRKAGTDPLEDQAAALLRFLEDEKEVFELFMVTDEELKTMCEACDQGGAIVGPLLKEMSRLVHTEYVLLGRSSWPTVEILRRSMFAPTVTGSPVVSAFRVIHRYERESRGYYGATIALLGRDAAGGPTLDAPITIRTMEVDRRGQLTIRVGATLVRGSDPATEVAETEAKIAGVLAAVAASGEPTTPPARLLDVVDNEQVQILLQRRNLYLSRFWFEPQSPNYNAVPELVGRTVTIIDAEDGFSSMLARMITQMGARVKVVGFADHSRQDRADITIAGPGPGDPSSPTDPKMLRMAEIITELRAQQRPLFAECLSHQILCHTLGLQLVAKAVPFQGAQQVIDLFGRPERVGFYNTFVALAGAPLPGLEVAADPTTGEIHALRGPGLYSAQFHAESILTPRGYELVRDALLSLIPAPVP
jgi:phenazine biosynthesis protein phzE